MPETIKREPVIIKPEFSQEKPLLPEKEVKVDPLAGEGLAGTFEQTKVLSAEPIVSAPLVSQSDLSPLEKQVESVLEEGLNELYLSLPSAEQMEFKKGGEQAARQISRILTKVRVSVRQIIKIIRRWLSIIPGVNKYFLEQTAKIKAEKIIKLH